MKKLAVVLFLFATLAGRAGEPGFLTRTHLLAAGRETTLTRYPDADAVVLEDVTRTVYQPDGTAIQREDYAVKVLTEKGRRDGGVLGFYFSAQYETVTVECVERITPEGQVIPVDVAEQGRVMVDHGQMSANIYDPNNKILQISIPGLETNDIYRWVAVRTLFKPRVPNTWSDITGFEGVAPTRHALYEVTAPAALPLRSIAVKSAVSNTLTASVQRTAGGSTVYRWEARDVPRYFEEPNMPAAHTVLQRALVSTIPDWPELSRWYWRLSQPRLDAVNDAMRAKVAELTAGKTQRTDRIRAIFGFVSQQVRYMGITIETEAPGYEPHDVCLTFDNRYGVCRDKAALLVALLRLAGFEAFPVLISVGPRLDAEVPTPYFNHAIVAVREADGSFQLMDPTNENTRDLFPSYLGDCSYLVATPAGEPLRVAPVPAAESNMLRVTTTGRLDYDGTLHAVSDLRFGGINDSAYRGRLAGMKPDERQRFFEQAIRRVYPGAELTGLAIAPQDVRDTEQPLSANLQFKVPRLLVPAADFRMLALPRLGLTFGVANRLLGQVGLEKRRFPLRTGLACGVEESVALRLDDGVGPAISLPGVYGLDASNLYWQNSYRFANGLLTGTNGFRLRAVEYSPGEYARLKDLLRQAEFGARQKFIFAPAAPDRDPEASSVLLEDNTDLELADANSGLIRHSTRRLILNYAGKKKFSEQRFDFNPAWDAVSVRVARVTSPDGQVQAVTAKELNQMDADWAGAAPRYPAGKILVVSLPGVVPGSVIELQTEFVFSNRPFVSLRDYFGGFDPVEHKRLRVSAPPTVPLRIGNPQKAGVQFTASNQDGRVEYIWEARRIPGRKPAENLPPAWQLFPAVFLSTGDWTNYAAQVHAALARGAAPAPLAAQTARELTAGMTNDEQRLLAIRDYAAIHVRPAGPEFSALPLTVISPADQTLREGYGDGADRAVLLYAMLTAAGFAPEFALQAQAPQAAERPLLDTPQRDVFGSVLVRVRSGGRTVYLNNTDQYAALGSLPDAGQTMLHLPDGQLAPAQAENGRETKAVVRWEVSLRTNGDARVTRTREWHGVDFEEAHRRFAELPPEERRRYHQEAVAAIAQSARAVGDLETDFSGYPGIEKMSVDVERLAVNKDGRFYFTLPGYDGAMFLAAPEYSRELPLYWPESRRADVLYQVTGPAGCSVETLPENWTWPAPGRAGRISQSVLQAGPAEIVLRVTADLKPAILTPGDYANLQAAAARLAHPAARTFVFRSAPVK